MGVITHYNNFIIPIEKIENSGFKGGFKKFIEQFTEEIGNSVFFDKYIVNFLGAPDNDTIHYKIKIFCDKYGLKGVVEGKDGLYWKDIYLFSVMDGINGVDVKCDWIESKGGEKFVRLKGTPEYPNYPSCDQPSYYRSYKYKNIE